MSEVKVNKLSPRSGTTVTLGDSGDTISIPSGVTLSNAGTNTFASATITGDLTVDTNTLKVDSTNNRVGIGTSNPLSRLEISDSTPVRFNLRNTGLDNNGEIVSFQWDNNANFTIQGRDSNAAFKANWYEITSTATDGYADEHIWYTGSSAERMRINSSGNVGIGTSSPSVKLQILGTENSADTQAIRLMENATQGGFIKYDGNVNELQLGGYNSGENTGIRIARNDATTYFNTNGSERMRIDSSGQVGIGTSSPIRNLVLATSSGDTTFRIETASQNNDVLTLRNGDGRLDFANTNMTILSNGKVGIGTNSPSSTLHISGDPQVTLTQPNNLVLQNDTDSATSGDAKTGILFRANYNGTTPTDLANITAGKENATNNNYGSFIGFCTRTNGVNTLSERMRIDSTGRLLINTTAALQESTELFAVNDGESTFDNDGNCVIVNRRTNDGGLVSFRQDGTQEGSITVSGTTVSYNGFTGTHWSRFTDNSKPTILKGTVLESLDEMCDWYNLEFDVIDEEGNITTKKIPHVLTDTQSNGDVITYNHEETDYQATIVKEADVKHMMSKVSDTVDAKNVYGVFNAYDEDGEGYNDFYVASVGTYVVRIKANETIAKGDLLQSNGDGTAKVQTDDNVKSSSFAKVLSTTVIETYEDGSFIVPCSLMC